MILRSSSKSDFIKNNIKVFSPFIKLWDKVGTSGDYRGLQGTTGDYRGLQGTTGDYRGL